MVADKFGDFPSNTMLFIHDSRGIYKSLTPNYDLNPVYNEYCFDVRTAREGDSVSLLVIGFKIQFFTEVCNYAVYMRFLPDCGPVFPFL